MYDLIFCCGWETNSIRCFLSYIFTYLSNYMIFRKILAHWLFNLPNDVFGGFPAILDDIQIEPEKVGLIVDSLFVHKTAITHNKTFKRIIAASVMRFH